MKRIPENRAAVSCAVSFSFCEGTRRVGGGAASCASIASMKAASARRGLARCCVTPREPHDKRNMRGIALYGTSSAHTRSLPRHRSGRRGRLRHGSACVRHQVEARRRHQMHRAFRGGRRARSPARHGGAHARRGRPSRGRRIAASTRRPALPAPVAGFDASDDADGFLDDVRSGGI